jgi:hypothetical protein
MNHCSLLVVQQASTDSLPTSPSWGLSDTYDMQGPLPPGHAHSGIHTASIYLPAQLHNLARLIFLLLPSRQLRRPWAATAQTDKA